MIETLGAILLWLLALAMLAAYPLSELARGMASNPDAFPRSRGAGIASVIGIALIALLLTGCSPPTVLSTPNSCATLLPTEWRQGVDGAAMPAADTVGDWIAFGDAQTGKLDQANGRTRDAIGIVERCEERDAKAVRKATRRWWQIF